MILEFALGLGSKHKLFLQVLTVNLISEQKFEKTFTKFNLRRLLSFDFPENTQLAQKLLFLLFVVRFVAIPILDLSQQIKVVFVWLINAIFLQAFLLHKVPNCLWALSIVELYFPPLAIQFL